MDRVRVVERDDDYDSRRQSTAPSTRLVRSHAMIAEVLLVLAGHSSSLFPTDHTVHPSFEPLLHPGEKQCLESLGRIAFQYRKLKEASVALARSRSRYICTLCSTLNQILKDEYESLVIETEAKILNKDSTLVASGSFVPLSSVRATFAEWDAPLAVLESLIEQIQAQEEWKPGPLIDMLIMRSLTGTHRIANIMSRLSVAVQRVWRTQLVAFLVHGSLSSSEPLASPDYTLLEGSIPSCVSAQAQSSIAYVGRAIGTVKAAKWQKQLPRSVAADHTKLLQDVLPEDQYNFDRVVAEIRTNVSEWLWLNVLTQKDVEDAVDSLANYFLIHNGEFSLSLIREIERLKVSRLTSRSGPSTMIREQDLRLALLRASLGTTAQHDPALARLHFHLPSGPLRPLLPSLSNPKNLASSVGSNGIDEITFDDLLLGTPLSLNYTVEWPLDLFLQPSDLQIYGVLFSYLSALRKTHIRIHTCWTSLSNSQRARRRWTGLGEGGTAEDLEVRKTLLRCGWGVVREMSWFLDNLLAYVMTDVIDVEFRRLKRHLGSQEGSKGSTSDRAPHRDRAFSSTSTRGRRSLSLDHGRRPSIVMEAESTAAPSPPLDFTTLRTMHSTYLERLLVGTLLSNLSLTSIIRPIFEVCEHLVAQVERWGGDVLPALLFEGSLAGSGDKVGKMVKERWAVVSEINDTFKSLLESFYEQLSLFTSQQPFNARSDASKSVLLNSTVNASAFPLTHTSIRSKDGKRLDGEGEVLRHIERLLLRLDFNGEFSRPKSQRRGGSGEDDILRQGGLA